MEEKTLLVYTGTEGKAVEGDPPFPSSDNDMTSEDWLNNLKMGLTDISDHYDPAVSFAEAMLGGEKV